MVRDIDVAGHQDVISDLNGICSPDMDPIAAGNIVPDDDPRFVTLPPVRQNRFQPKGFTRGKILADLDMGKTQDTGRAVDTQVEPASDQGQIEDPVRGFSGYFPDRQRQPVMLKILNSFQKHRSFPSLENILGIDPKMHITIVVGFGAIRRTLHIPHLLSVLLT